MYYRIQPRHQFLIALAKFAKCLSLGSENVRDCLGTVAEVKLGGEGMVVQAISCHPPVLASGGIKYGGKVIDLQRTDCLIGCRHWRDGRKELGKAHIMDEGDGCNQETQPGAIQYSHRRLSGISHLIWLDMGDRGAVSPWVLVVSP
jgi:hypothetical protein